MKKGTVRRRIFVSDTAMVLATLFLFLLVNLLVLKIYSEAIEKAFLDSAEQIVNAQELEELLKQRILYQNKFLLLTAADGIACVLILIGVSRFFTRNLTSHIMEPLDTLAEGAKRIQNNDLQQAKNIRYTCTQVAEARRHLGEPFLQNREPQRIAFEPVALMKDQSFVINRRTAERNSFWQPGSNRKRPLPDRTLRPGNSFRKRNVPLRNGLSTARNRRKSIHRRQGCRSVTGERLLRNGTVKRRAGEMFVSVFYGGEITDIKTYKIVISVQMTE